MGVRKGQLEGHLLVLVTLGLVAFGLVMVFSATSAAATIGNGDPITYLKRQAVYAAFGVAVLIGASRFDYRALPALAPPLVLVSLALCVVVLVVGPAVNGARRWLTLGPASLQPSELAKLALALWAAGYLARKPPPRRVAELVRPIGLLVGLFAALILLEPDLGTVIVIVTMLAAMLLVAGTPMRVLGSAGAIVFGLGLIVIWLEPYRRARLLSFLDPWQDPENSGFQTIQAMIGFGSGGIFGDGLGEGIAKVNYLPEAHTDMILAVVGEELGLVGTTAVILAYGAFAYAGLRIALEARDPFAKRLAAGLVAMICGQAAINVAAVLGLAPLTGIPLPFVSYGGSSLVVALASVGILLNIAGSHGAQGRAGAAGSDRGRGDGRARPAGARGRRSAAGSRRDGDVRRVAGARRSTARS
jgi:cell division protein FtsW